jgi:hypothetical protein
MKPRVWLALVVIFFLLEIYVNCIVICTGVFGCPSRTVSVRLQRGSYPCMRGGSCKVYFQKQGIVNYTEVNLSWVGI